MGMLERGGNLEASDSVKERIKKASDEIRAIEEKYTVLSEGDIVCEVCGVRCSMDGILHGPYEGHLASNLHVAYQKIRYKVKELQEKFRHVTDAEHGVEKTGGERSRRDRRDDRGGDRSDRDRDRERDRGRDRDRDDRRRRERSRSR